MGGRKGVWTCLLVAEVERAPKSKAKRDDFLACDAVDQLHIAVALDSIACHRQRWGLRARRPARGLERVRIQRKQRLFQVGWQLHACCVQQLCVSCGADPREHRKTQLHKTFTCGHGWLLGLCFFRGSSSAIYKSSTSPFALLLRETPLQPPPSPA